MSILALQSRLTNARKAVASASTAKAREKAAGELEEAAQALARAQSKLSQKTVKTVKKEERYEEEDEDEDESEEEKSTKDSEEESDDEPKKPMGKKSEEDEESKDCEAADDEDDDSGDDDDDDDDGDDTDDGDDADEESDEEDEENDDEEADSAARAEALLSARSILSLVKKSKDERLVKKAKSHLAQVKRAATPKGLGRLVELRAAAQRVTGKLGHKAVLGALDALAASQKETERLSAEVAKIKGTQRKGRIDSMLTEARAQGKISAKETAHLRESGMRHGTKWLRAHLDVRPKMVRSIEDGPVAGQTAQGGKDGDAPVGSTSEKLSAQSMSEEQRKVVSTMAEQAGLTFDAFLESMNKTRAKVTGGAN